MRIGLLLLLLLGIIPTVLVAAQQHPLDDPERDDPEYEAKVEVAVKRWQENFRKVKRMASSALKMAMPYFMDSVTSGNLSLSDGCKRSLFQWIADLRSAKPYALRMADASAKMFDGILTGTLSAFGSYDQCLDIEVPSHKGVRGQYCTIEARPHLPPKPRFYALNQRLKAFKRFENDTGMMGEFTKHVQLFYNFPFRVGICVPSTCSKEDLFNLSTAVVAKVFPTNITIPNCEIREELVVEYFQIPFLCVIGILVTLVICGTLTDIVLNRMEEDSDQKPQQRGYGTKCVLSFSVVKNWNLLMDTEAGSDDLSVLHGIRFFTMCWIIFGHTYFHLNFNLLKYLQITIELISKFAFNSITNATLLVDNFFFLSGLLFIYIGADISKKTGKIPNPFYFAVHRVWRFVPIQMFFVGISTLLPFMGDGPMWHENIDPVVEGCKKDWWANFIFINNLYRSSPKGCLSYSWYLAADFQVYIICIPLVITILKKPVIGMWVNFVIMVLSVVGVGVHNYLRELPPAILFTRADNEQRHALMMETYYFPLHHLGPHCLGIIVGYYLRQKKSPKNMHWALHLVAWIVTFTLTTCSLFGVHPWNTGVGETGVVATVLYASLSRMSWTLGLAWITIACSTGCGGFLESILKWKPFIPLSRLTFMVYMVHPLVQYVFYASLRDGIQARNSLAVFIFLGFTVSSYIIAVFACLLVEAPFVNLGKVVFEIEEAIRKGHLTLGSLLSGNTTPMIPAAEENGGSKPFHIPRINNGYLHDEGNCHPRLSRMSNGSLNNGNDFVCRL